MLSLWRGSTHYSNYSSVVARREEAQQVRTEDKLHAEMVENEMIDCIATNISQSSSRTSHTHTHYTPLLSPLGGRKGRISLNYSLASLCSTNQIHQLGNWEFCLEFPLDVSASLLLSILSLSVATLVLHLKITAFTKQTVNHMYVNIKYKIFSIILLKFSYKIHHLNYDNLMYHSWNNRKS